MSCSPNSSQKPDNADYEKKYKEARHAPMTETKCLAGIELGQTPEQLDSVWGGLYDKYLLASRDFYDWDQQMSEKSRYTINTSCIKFVHDSEPFNIEVEPEFLNNRLSELVCIIKPINKRTKEDKPLYILFSEIFQETSRAQQFEKFTVVEGDTDDTFTFISFIKDNMEIRFYPQPDEIEGTMVYRNVPDDSITHGVIHSVDL